MIQNPNLTPEENQLLLRIQLKLIGLGVKAGFSHKTSGPVVSTYFYNLDYSVPIAKILKKEEDIAIACGVSRVLITRDEDKIAIAIPNKERLLVAFDSCLHFAFQKQRELGSKAQKLPLILGVNPIGELAMLDLYDQPHVLIAGSTGSGKSILLQSLLSGLALMRTKAEMRLILVDTKKLDLNLFSTLPHVIDNVEDPVQMHTCLNRLMQIVRKRTDTMKGLARNIAEYNSLGLTSPMPYYVVVIDEIADLIDLDKNQTEWEGHPEYADYPRLTDRLKSLLQICRAAGVHVICATQRSSVDVIKGTIKANLPTRIALKLPSRFDSMCVLSQSGAQNLLGKGDMLVEANNEPIHRYHGAFISSTDICNILNNADQIREQFLVTQ